MSDTSAESLPQSHGCGRSHKPRRNVRAGGKRSIACRFMIIHETRCLININGFVFLSDALEVGQLMKKCPAMSDLIHHVTTYVRDRNTIALPRQFPSLPSSRFVLTSRRHLSRISSLERDDDEDLSMVWWKRCANGAK